MIIEKSGCPGEGTLEKVACKRRADFSPDDTVFDQLAQLIHLRGPDPALFDQETREELESWSRTWSQFRAVEKRLAYFKDHDADAYAKFATRICDRLGPLVILQQRLDELQYPERGLQIWCMASGGPNTQKCIYP